MLQNQIFNDLVWHTHAVVDHYGEAHCSCPECGHESSPKKPHCSFSLRGFYCFVCGYGCSLYTLAFRMGVKAEESKNLTLIRPQAAPGATQQAKPIEDGLVRQFESAAGVVEAWQKYKPLTEATIRAHRLGLGILPRSRCCHERLIVPIFDGSQCVSLRGRRVGCECEAKWLSSAGSTLDRLPLYPGNFPRGAVVMIVENCTDALLVSQETGYHGVAIYSTSYWRDVWAQVLLQACPALVVVALDNDLVGNGGAARRAEFVSAWLKTHPVVPESRGIRLTNLLLAAGLPAMLWDWGNKPYKYDMGSLIMEEKYAAINNRSV